MTKTLEMNGPARKTLASQLDRLPDGQAHRLAHGLRNGLVEALAQPVED